MRILIVNSLYPPEIIGGAEISTKKIAEELAYRGQEVFVLATGDSDQEIKQNGVTVIQRRFHNIMSFWAFKHSTTGKRIVWKAFDYINLLNNKVINAVIDDVSPDVIHTNTLYGITPCIWKCASKKRIPVVQTLRDYNLMCPKSNLMRRNKMKCTKPRMVCQVYRKGYRRLTQTVQAVTAPSLYTLNCFLEDGYFQKAYKKVIYNAIDYDEMYFHNLAERRLKGGDCNQKNVIFIGSFIETKGIPVLLDAIRECPKNIIFHFAGKGRLENQIKAAMNDCSNIVFHGFLAENELNLLLQDMDILVCPSIWAEPFGRVIIDGYKACIPAVVSNCGGMPELIEDGVTGFLVQPNSSTELARGIMMACNTTMTKERIEAIRLKLNNFSIVYQGDQFMSIYRNVRGGAILDVIFFPASQFIGSYAYAG